MTKLKFALLLCCSLKTALIVFMSSRLFLFSETFYSCLQSFGRRSVSAGSSTEKKKIMLAEIFQRLDVWGILIMAAFAVGWPAVTSECYSGFR